jgi:mycothiol synthase
MVRTSQPVRRAAALLTRPTTPRPSPPPSSRGQGLGRQVCAALTAQLLALGHTRLFGSTPDHRLAALRIYLDLGFVPAHWADRVERWLKVMETLGVDWTPDARGW